MKYRIISKSNSKYIYYIQVYRRWFFIYPCWITLRDRTNNYEEIGFDNINDAECYYRWNLKEKESVYEVIKSL